MKKLTTKIIFIIIIMISIIYVIYNIFINRKTKQSVQENNITKEKEIVTDMRIGVINFDSINPIISTNTNVQNVSRLIFEPLINLTQDYRLEPCLATEWTKLDEKTYLIKLRENVKWQDGKQFNSDDVLFTINILKNELDNSIYHYNVNNIKEVKKIDEYTVKIIAKEEIPYFEYQLIFPILSSKYFNTRNIKSDKKNLNPVGTGMYYIADNNKGNILLKINSNWWGDKQLKLDTININLYKDINSAISDVKSSNVDLITSSLINIDKYIDSIQCNTKKYIGRDYDYLSINCDSSILKNKEVRQAIAYAIDKESIIKEVYNNQYIQSEFPLDFGSYLYNKNSEKIIYNLTKAKKKLKDNNWKYRNQYWIKKINGRYKTIKLKLLVNKDNEKRIEVAKLIKKQLEEIGIQIIIIEKNEKEYKNSISNKDYELLLTGITYGYSPSVNTYFEENNLSNYNNEEIKEKLKQMENDTEEERKTILSEIIKYYNKDAPYISLYYNTNTLIYSNSLRGEINPNSYNLFYGIENWYREYDK